MMKNGGVIRIRKMSEQECIDMSTKLRESLVELARVLPFVDKDDTVRIESCRLMEEISHIIYAYGRGIQTPLKLGVIADRIKEPVSILCSLLEPFPVCKANQDAYAAVMAVNNIIEKDILHVGTTVTLNDELFDAPY